MVAEKPVLSLQEREELEETKVPVVVLGCLASSLSSIRHGL